jgi:SSS family solute:Na+ symporter
MAWIPLMARISGTLYQYLQDVQSNLAPPIAAVFLIGVFHKRVNANGAFAALVSGFLIGILKLTLQIFKTSLSGLALEFANINFLYFCIYLFLFSIGVLVVVSLLGAKPDEVKIQGLTFSTTVAKDKAASRASWNAQDVWLSIVVIVIIVSIFVYFSPLGIAK